MAERNSCGGEDLTDEDEEEEELDPRVQDELEKLNLAANSINHLEAELDEARAVFRQTMAAATYHLNDQVKKLGKCVEKARPFYDVLREMRKAHSQLQKATLQYEKASSRHVYARKTVHEAEQRVFFGGEKRVFDAALQEILNQATIEVNEAENQKKESWVTHQKMYKSYQEVEQKARTMQSKLKKSIEKARPYFTQKVSFDRHLWQLKLRVDSIQKGLGEAKVNYSECLRSLEVISDDIHQKRKDKKTLAMLANLQEREAGVGADSEDEASLDQSQLDLDLDCNSSLSELDGIAAENLPDLPILTGRVLTDAAREPSGVNASTEEAAVEQRNMDLGSISSGALERSVSGAESNESVDSDSLASLVRSGSFKREVYGCEQGEGEAEESDIASKESQREEYEETTELTEKLDRNITLTSESDWPENISDTPVSDSSSAQQEKSTQGSNFSEEILVQEQAETKSLGAIDSCVTSIQKAAAERTQKRDSESSFDVNNTDDKHGVSSECESLPVNDDVIEVTLKDASTVLSLEVLAGNTADQCEPQKEPVEATPEQSSDNGEWI